MSSVLFSGEPVQRRKAEVKAIASLSRIHIAEYSPGKYFPGKYIVLTGQGKYIVLIGHIKV